MDFFGNYLPSNFFGLFIFSRVLLLFLPLNSDKFSLFSQPKSKQTTDPIISSMETLTLSSTKTVTTKKPEISESSGNSWINQLVWLTLFGYEDVDDFLKQSLRFFCLWWWSSHIILQMLMGYLQEPMTMNGD